MSYIVFVFLLFFQWYESYIRQISFALMFLIYIAYCLINVVIRFRFVFNYFYVAKRKQDHGQPLQCFPLLKTHCSYNYCLKEIGALKCQAVTNGKYECE